MKRFAAALALALILVIPRTAPAGENWDQYKEAWEDNPWPIIVVFPAVIVTAPFMLVNSFLDWLGEDDDEDEYY